MYHRKNEKSYYKRVLLPLERDTVRKREDEKRRRGRRYALQRGREFLRHGNFRVLARSIKGLLKNEYITFKRIRQPATHPGLWKLYFSDKRIAVYTVIFGGYDKLKEPFFSPDNVDYFVFTDREVAPDSKWRKMPCEALIGNLHMTDTEKNRYLKMHPHLLFPDYEYSIYLDGNIQVTADMTPFAMLTNSFPVGMHLHREKDCVYEEIDDCLKKGKDSPKALLAHRALLQDMGIPEHWGLLEAGEIACRLHDPVCIRIMETWWECFFSGCRRDQISLMQCLWMLKIPPQLLGKLGDNQLLNSKFTRSPHEVSTQGAACSKGGLTDEKESLKGESVSI